MVIAMDEPHGVSAIVAAAVAKHLSAAVVVVKKLAEHVVEPF